MHLEKESRVLIIGGGFGGVQTALSLARKKIPNLNIELVSNRTHFEYYPLLYKVVTETSLLSACISLSDIFDHTAVNVTEDTIISVDLEARIALGASGSHYRYTYLVLALGSEASYFNIPGIEQYSHSFKSVNEALRLKRHITDLLSAQFGNTDSSASTALHMVLVGGGPSGVELAADLSEHLKHLARKYHLPKKAVTVDLIEAAPRILPMLAPSISARVERHLKRLGVQVMTSQAVVKEDIENVYMKDLVLHSKTLIWTAGTRPNRFYQTLNVPLEKNGKVLTNYYLEVQGRENVFVIGDAASTKYSGMAQTALSDGNYVAKVIGGREKGKRVHTYEPKKPFYLIPVGRHFSVFVFGRFHIYGHVPLLIRRLADLRYFLSILPFSKALRTFSAFHKQCENCSNPE